jgi:hypothetical protein
LTECAVTGGFNHPYAGVIKVIGGLIMTPIAFNMMKSNDRRKALRSTLGEVSTWDAEEMER